MADNRKEVDVSENRTKKIVKEYVEAFVIAIILALIIRTFIVQAFKIPSSSMEPTLLIGDHLLVNKFIYGIKMPFVDKKIFQFKKPERGDIIVFKYPEDPSIDFIKRVIAVEGDRVEILKKKVFINGVPVPDPYAHFADDMENFSSRPKDNFGPVVVPDNSVFCMGDNRDRSHDSRWWGYVDLNMVRGKAFILYFSWNGESNSVLGKIRWSRFGKLLHD
ncbi:signal peptidase I [Thermodesulfobacteriota bacterium]